jgi:hypothetical protein
MSNITKNIISLLQEKATDAEKADHEMQMKAFLTKGGAVKQAKAKKEPRARFYTSSSAFQRGRGTGKAGTVRMEETDDEREYDYEGEMAKTQLRSIMRHAEHLHGMLEDADNLPEWVQSKITKAEDYLSGAHDYMMSKMNEQTDITELSTRKEEVEIDEASSAYGRINKRFKDLSGRSLDAAAKEWGDKAKDLQKQIDAQAAENERRKAAMKKEEADLDEIAVVKTNKPIGTRVADIGPGGKEYNIKTNKAYDDAKKKNPKGREGGVIKAIDHLAKEEAEHIDEATPTKQQVKQAIGIARDPRYRQGNVSGAVEAMKKINPGLDQHPVVKKELQKQNEDVVDEEGKLKGGAKDPCWKGYEMVGTKKKNGKEVPNCVPKNEERYLKKFINFVSEEQTMHPMGLHISHSSEKKNGLPAYKVHAVGAHLADGIKVGEHLTDPELDDAVEMGAKIKHIKQPK